jgi:hypothetical protein
MGVELVSESRTGTPLAVSRVAVRQMAIRKGFPNRPDRYCVDVKTEIFTKRGWLKHVEVIVGDESLAINPDTGMSEWQSITDLYMGHFSGIPMVAMEGQSFSAPDNASSSVADPT